MIKIIRATEQPIESHDYWSYPIEELDYVLENADEDTICDTFLLFEGRLYEAPYLNEDEEGYIRSSTNGDYSPSAPWGAPGMSIKDFI
jgi:hypothetical protein